MMTNFLYIKVFNMDIKVRFWAKIREIRKIKWLSQEELAAKCRLHRTYIWIIERWEKNVCLENIEILANSLDIEIKDLFNN